MKDIINSEIYKLTIRKKDIKIISASIAAIIMVNIYFFVYKKVDSSEYLLAYFDKIYGMALVLVSVYNYFFQADFTYDVYKNHMWIFGNLKKIFRGKIVVQIALVTLNYVAITIPTVLFLVFSKREIIGIGEIILVMFSYYFILIRMLMVINIFTNLWRNDYITFALGWFVVNVFGLLTGIVEDGLNLGEVVSSHTIQGQMVGLVTNVVNNSGLNIDILINILLTFLGIIICEYIYVNKK